MSWVTLDSSLQTKVLDRLRVFATEEKDETLSYAFVAAANELELWIENSINDSFTAWLDTHHDELSKHAGKAVAVHLEKGVLATASAESFWDGTFHTDTSALFHNDPSIFITVVPSDTDIEDGVEAVEQK